MKIAEPLSLLVSLCLLAATFWKVNYAALPRTIPQPPAISPTIVSADISLPPPPAPEEAPMPGTKTRNIGHQPIEPTQEIDVAEKPDTRSPLDINVPNIQIHWPRNRLEKVALYNRLIGCHGLQHAVLVSSGALYRMDDPPGTAWQIDLEIVSSLFRQPHGRLTEAEAMREKEIRERHALGTRGRLIRLFPRTVDVLLLNDLGRIGTGGLAEVTEVSGRYILRGGKVAIADLKLDGRPSGALLWLPVHGAQCKRAA